MRPPQYYPNMPPKQNFQYYPNSYPPYGYQGPFPYGRMNPPHYPPNTMPRLDSFMEAANKFISTYQSFQPLIAQATPMIRNLPALWKLYKGFQSIPNQNNSQKEKFQNNFLESTPKQTEKRVENPYRENKPREFQKGKSYPRIYQPPFYD